MPLFIQYLESRTLLSTTPITSAALLADVQNVAAASTAAKAALKTIHTTLLVDAKTLGTDLKAATTATNHKSNATLVKTLKADEGKAIAGLRADATVLLTVGSGVAKRAAKDALKLLKTPTNTAAAASVATDATALGSAGAAPLAKLQTALAGLGLNVDLANITVANPGSVAVATDAQSTGDAISAFITTLTTDAAAFINSLATLGADVVSTPTQSTLPNVVGPYSGSTRTNSGPNNGLVRFLDLNITSETPGGVLAGTGVFTPLVGQISLNFTGMLAKDTSHNSDAIFTGVLTDPTTPGRGMTLTGNVFGTVLQGTYVGTGGIDNADFTINLT